MLIQWLWAGINIYFLISLLLKYFVSWIILFRVWVFCSHTCKLSMVVYESLCSQRVPGEMEQVQPLLSGARGQKWCLQQARDRAECWGEAAAAAQSTPTHQGSYQWRHQLCLQRSRSQVEHTNATPLQEGVTCSVKAVHLKWSLSILPFSKFINMMMKHGNKVLARDILTQVRKWTVRSQREGQRFVVSFITQISKTCFRPWRAWRGNRWRNTTKLQRGRRKRLSVTPTPFFTKLWRTVCLLLGWPAYRKVESITRSVMRQKNPTNCFVADPVPSRHKHKSLIISCLIPDPSQVPIPLTENRRRFLAMKWMITECRDNKHRRTHMYEKLSQELLAAHEKEGNVIKKKYELHKMAEANRAYAHYRWW